MKTIQPSGFGTSRPVDDIRLILASFIAWGLAFAFGAWLVGRQLAKITQSAEVLNPVNSILIGLAAFGLMLGLHFLRAKVLRNPPEYSVKFLAFPGVILLLEVALFWILRL